MFVNIFFNAQGGVKMRTSYNHVSLTYLPVHVCVLNFFLGWVFLVFF